ncbi:glycosyltransferase family 2 protein [Haloarchaeobius sp. HRN-SO-5]|uniref:glycosyltransferase family 2 protein n=1 Tax=Haloarchaeobius sp. HRN-SO-5 TaxID=3446118 RepID=UPI003EB6B8C4
MIESGQTRQLGRGQTALLVAVVVVAYAAGFLVLPDGTFALSTAFVATTGVGLLGSYHAFGDGVVPMRSHIGLLRWFLLGLTIVTGLAVVAVETGRLDLEAVGFAAFVVVPGSYLVSLVARTVRRRATPPSYAVPLWLGGTMLLFGATAAVGRYVVDLSPFELVLLGGLEVMAFYVGFIVPVGIWEIMTDSDPPDATEPYPEVSVAIPAYNEEAWIGKCLDSVLASNYPAEKLEVIVVDDGSEDATYERASEYRDRGVRVVQRPNGGRDAALNYGFFCSNGDVFVMVDADSLLAPDALSKIVGALQADPDLGAVAGDIRVLNTDRLITKIQAIEYVFSINTFRRACSFFNAVPIAPGALSGFRREALEAVGGFDPDTLTEDFDTTVQILEHDWTVRQVSAISYTEAPFTLRDLYTQRIRWYTGGLQCILKHVNVFAGSRSSYLHRFTFPFLSLSYVFRPIVGLAATGIIVYGLLTSQAVLTLVGFGYFVAVVGVVAAITLYMLNVSFRILPWYVFLMVGYKQFIDVVFLRSIVKVVTGAEVEWGTIRRQAEVDWSSRR